MNRMISKNKELMKLWDFQRNEILGIDPNEQSEGSHTKACWTCDKGHKTIQVIKNKKNGRGCAYCERQKLLPGYNDLKTLKPEIAAEWDYEANSPFKPEDFFSTEDEYVWWKCNICGNSYDCTINKRSRGDSCPYCSGRRVKEGFNDLLTKKPDLCDEWDFERNIILPTQVTTYSNQYVWWKDALGHRWKAQINSRSQGKGCPYCAGQKVLAGFNDLKTRNESLASEWNFKKNGTLLPTMFTANSTETVWWTCKTCGCEWISSIDNRMRDRGCPKCKSRSMTSFPEQAIFFYIKQVFSDAINGFKGIFENTSSEIDIYIPSISTGIEYDGPYHDSDKSRARDLRKYDICKSNNIKLIRLRNNIGNDDGMLCDILIPCYFNTGKYAELDNSISILASYLKCNLDIDTSRDKNVIMAQYVQKLKKGALAEMYPDIALEWHPTLNGELTPSMFSYASGESVWWKCHKCGSEWQARIYSRTRYKTGGCKKCKDAENAYTRCKRVKNINTGEIYDSLQMASKATGISRDSISKVCRGIKSTVKGIKWEFV